MKKILSVFTLMFSMLAFVGMVQAEKLATPMAPSKGKVLLTVEGQINRTNGGDKATFDRERLLNLGVHTLKTSNPFIKGVHTFEGVYLSDVLDAAGANGKTITALAIDGYSTDIPVSDAHKYKPLIALKMDGKVMRVRTKGPLWIVYPVDQIEELRSEKFSPRSIWQLITLTVK